MSVARETQRRSAIGADPTVARETRADHHAHAHGDPSAGSSTDSSPGLAASLLLGPIRAYRHRLSPMLAPRCRYYPSCSEYAVEAISELGALRGAILAAWRVLRCNPLSDGGIDPVSERPLFRSTAAPAPAGPRAPGGGGDRR